MEQRKEGRIMAKWIDKDGMIWDTDNKQDMNTIKMMGKVGVILLIPIVILIIYIAFFYELSY